MSDWEVLIGQMVSDIAAQVHRLDDLRLRLFLHWLMAHRVEVKASIGNDLELDQAALRGADMRERLRAALSSRLKSLPAQGLLWEYQTILAEIGWWRDIDPQRLSMIPGSEDQK